MWLHSLKVAQLLRSAACLHTNQSRSYLNHLVHSEIIYDATNTLAVAESREACLMTFFSILCSLNLMIFPRTATISTRLNGHVHSEYVTADLFYWRHCSCVFLVCWQNCEKRLLDFVMSVCLSVRPHGITRFPRFFFSFSKVCRVSLKSDKNNGYFTRRPKYICDHISLSSSKDEKYVTQKLYRKSKHTHYVQ